MRKKCSKDSTVSTLNSISDVNNQSSRSIKEFSKTNVVQDLHENSQFYDENFEDIISMVYSGVNKNAVNNFSSDVFINGLHSATEVEETKYVSTNLCIQNYDGDDSNIANGYFVSSNESCNTSWTDQEFLVSNIPQDSFKSCQSSLQSSLSSISSSLSSNKTDYYDDGKPAHVSYCETSYASNFLHKSVDDSVGAKLDVLSSFDDYEMCLHSNHQYELIKDRNDNVSSLDAYSRSRVNTFSNSCPLIGPEKNEVSQSTSSDFMFGDFSASKTNLKGSSNVENEFSASYEPSSIAIDDGNFDKVGECHKVVSSPVVSSSHDDTSSEDARYKSDRHLFRAPVEFVNYAVEDLNLNSTLGISFGFGLEDLLRKGTPLQAELPNANSSGHVFVNKDNFSTVTSCMNLSFSPSFVVTTCLSSPVLYSWSVSSTNPPTIISNVPNYLSNNNNNNNNNNNRDVNIKNNNSSSPICKHEYSSKGNQIVQESNHKSTKKDASRPLVRHKNLISQASNCTLLPSLYDRKLHVSLDVPVRNGFMRNNLSDIYRTSKNVDASNLPCSSPFIDSGSRMDELDNCFLPPIFNSTSHKNTFNLKAAQRFLYESYKETSLQNQSYIDKSFFRNKSSRLCESRGTNRNLKLAMTTT